MKTALLALCLLSPAALACDTSHLSLSGGLSVKTCSPKPGSTDCVDSSVTLHAYMEAVPDDDSLFSIGLQSSPWHMYDGDMRILTADDIAATVKPRLDAKVKRVELIGSWTGVSPQPGVPSLADRLSKALDGFPVKGENGFLWLKKDGARRTTRQAFTVREGGGSYFLPKGAELFVPLVAGWPAFVQDQIPEDNAEMLMRAAAGQEIFFLCPDKALEGFEHAAGKGSAVAAYNAAIMRLERGDSGDRAAALALLERGATLGDAKSRVRLDAERARK